METKKTVKNAKQIASAIVVNDAKKALEKVNSKESAKVIASSKEVVNDNDLLTQLNELNINSLVEKTARGNKSLWKKDFLQSIASSEKVARRKVRNNFQLPLSNAIVNKANNTYTKQATLKDLCNALKKFYTISLVSFNNYSNLSETSEHYKVIHSAYAIMKKELKLN